jgi:NADH-quinone oxidoreductase subunit D
MIENLLHQTAWLGDLQKNANGHFSARVEIDDFIETVNFLKEDLQFLILFNHYVLNENSLGPKLYLDLYNPLDQAFLCLEIKARVEKPFLELKDTWKNLALFEHEARDLNGISYKRVVDPVHFFSGTDNKNKNLSEKRLLPHRPLKDLGKFPRNIDHYHCSNPQLWGSQLLLDMDLQTIYQSVYFYGLHHRGIETSLVGDNLDQLRARLSTVNPAAAYSYDLGLIWGIEKQLGIKIPNRALAIRMLLIELERMISHLSVLKGWAHEVADEKSFEGLSNIHRQLKFLLLQTASKGLVFCPGGIIGELDRSWIEVAFRLFKKIEPELKKLESKIQQNSSTLALNSVAKINLKDCIDWGCSGPVARASGVRLDWRAMDDFGLYREVDFYPILLKDGTTMDRLMLRLLEVEQSRNILVQLLENLPLNQSFSHGFNDQNIDYSNLSLKTTFESPEGLIQLCFNFDNESKIKFGRIVGPSYSNTQLMNEKLKGVQLRDLELVMVGFNPCNTEIDR